MKGHTPHILEGITCFRSQSNDFLHYTCNAPTQETLDNYEIKAIGSEYGCANKREVLKIPLKVYLEHFNFTKNNSVLILNLEALMSILSGRERLKAI